MDNLKIDWIGGEFPVQGGGTINGKKFYFRSRFGEMAFRILTEKNLRTDPYEWEYQEDYNGDYWEENPTDEEARAFIEKAAAIYMATVEIDFDPEDYIEEISTAKLETELTRRRMKASETKLAELSDYEPRDLILLADLIADGKTSEALDLLVRFHPKEFSPSVVLSLSKIRRAVMADKPILFPAPMIRAMLEGRNTQSRSLLTARNATIDGLPARQMWADIDLEKAILRNQSTLLAFFMEYDAPADIHLFAPHKNGETSHRVRPVVEIGDRLWIREAWRTESDDFDDLTPSEMIGEETILYEADGDWSLNKSTGRPRSSRYMPRAISRMTLIVTDVKIERLQDISEADAIAEGMEHHPPGRPATVLYWALWDRSNKTSTWATNPFVVVVTYDVIKANIDHIPATWPTSISTDKGGRNDQRSTYE